MTLSFLLFVYKFRIHIFLTVIAIKVSIQNNLKSIENKTQSNSMRTVFVKIQYIT